MTVVSIELNVPEQEEVSVASNTSMEGFFDSVDVIAEAMASATFVATREVSIEALVPQSEPIFHSLKMRHFSHGGLD